MLDLGFLRDNLPLVGRLFTAAAQRTQSLFFTAEDA
jgi:hypothetical protein